MHDNRLGTAYVQDGEYKEFHQILTRVQTGMATARDADWLRRMMLRAWDERKGERDGR